VITFRQSAAGTLSGLTYRAIPLELPADFEEGARRAVDAYEQALHDVWEGCGVV
jgi:hypothetical protein